MKTLKYILRVFQFLREKLFSNNQPINELIHPRFEITKRDPSAQKKAVNSLLFLMYSQENEAMFI
ncbi:hypothetical protein H4V97_001624 [Flavobacterium sp. CG_23.5]|uniref:hypothetical protein n=1 Tax=unclassified Flavobacterium TaxID=196869 RepID=UPI0018CBC551|nr:MULTISPECIES: hypothetical protein [unclassified Flavobacterium]MBG6109450.1 hypothetical protein [Flavobacterium sp. CG_9.10]MBP2283306.1 hypothetical protein [Flavobacterium sp. CG_23.5]